MIRSQRCEAAIGKGSRIADREPRACNLGLRASRQGFFIRKNLPCRSNKAMASKPIARIPGRPGPGVPSRRPPSAPHRVPGGGTPTPNGGGGGGLILLQIGAAIAAVAGGV